MTQYVAAVLFAVVAHEVSHLFAMRLLGIKRGRMSFGVFGVGIEADYSLCSYFKQAVVSLSGSGVNILMSAVLRSHAELSAASLAYGVFNLLPHSSLDGGELVDLTLASLGVSDRKRSCVSRFIDFGFTVILWTVSVYLALNGVGEGLLISSLYMVFSTICTSRS